MRGKRVKQVMRVKHERRKAEQGQARQGTSNHNHQASHPTALSQASQNCLVWAHEGVGRQVPCVSCFVSCCCSVLLESLAVSCCWELGLAVKARATRRTRDTSSIVTSSSPLPWQVSSKTWLALGRIREARSTLWGLIAWSSQHAMRTHSEKSD